MTTTLPKQFIKSTCRDIWRKTQQANRKTGELKALTDSAAALQKVLTDNGISVDDVNKVIVEIQNEDAAEAKKRAAEPVKAKATKAAA